MSLRHRELKDLGDVQQLIFSAALPKSFAESLSPSVREKYCELWDLAEEQRNQSGPS
jgi:hypothetical protein